MRNHNTFSGSEDTAFGFDGDQYVPKVQPSVAATESIEDILAAIHEYGYADEIIIRLTDGKISSNQHDIEDAIRIILIELAAHKNREMAIDCLLYLTGIGELTQMSLAYYAERHGCTKEGFRKNAEALKKRIGLDRSAKQMSDEARSKYKLTNGGNY